MAIQRTTNSVMRKISHFLDTQSKPLTYVAAVFCALIILFFVHKMWITRRERAAQYDFSSLMTEYETLSADKNPEWDALLDKFEKNYEKHSTSSLLPYYQGYKVRILVNQGKKDEALATLDAIVEKIPGSSLLALYETEQALMRLDSQDKDVQYLGLEALKKLAHDTHNQFRDNAQYYLGRYYWANNDFDAARAVWQQLVDEQRDEKVSPSPWASYVQDKLALTIA